MAPLYVKGLLLWLPVSRGAVDVPRLPIHELVTGSAAWNRVGSERTSGISPPSDMVWR
jgi:hypothetical protein